jgi:hypothetical protein
VLRYLTRERVLHELEAAYRHPHHQQRLYSKHIRRYVANAYGDGVPLRHCAGSFQA